jgi:crotonobetainyl-CoA:carnitine CoA-transferase CaiB-like acyl-CoA transferase
MVLADLGAEVICIEDPTYPFTRPPPFYQVGRQMLSGFSAEVLRNKFSVTLDLKKPGAREILVKLIQSADVFLESFRPGVATKLGLDYNTVKEHNPHLIYCSLTGYGQTGPYRLLPGHDINYAGLAGSVDFNRPRTPSSDSNPAPSDPIPPGLQAADSAGGLYAAIGILAAIIDRNKQPDHPGQYLDIAILDSAFSLMTLAASYHFSQYRESPNPFHGIYPFYTVYRTQDDKHLSLGALEPKFWGEFCKAIGLPDLSGLQFATGNEREDVFQKVQDRLLEKTQTEWLQIFQNYDTCVMPILSFADACTNAQIQARNMVINTPHAPFLQLQNVASPIKSNRYPDPLPIRHICPNPGEHNIPILQSLGFSDNQIKEFKKQGLFSP